MILKSWLLNPALIYNCLVISETRTYSKPKKIQTQTMSNIILSYIPVVNVKIVYHHNLNVINPSIIMSTVKFINEIV